MAEAVESFACKSCGKKYKWKQTLAGRTVKCKCGSTVHVPVGGGGAAVGGGGPMPAMAGAGPVSAANFPGARRMTQPDPSDEPSGVFLDWYLPIILIVAGSALSISMMAWMGDGGIGLGYAIPIFLISTVFDLILLFIGGLVVVKLFDTGLGHPGQAVVKFAAIAIAPPAVAMLVSWAIGDFTGLMGWILSMILCFALLYYFFDMDFFEMCILSTLVSLVRTWLSYIMIAFLLGAMGGDSGGFGGGVGGPGGGGAGVSPSGLIVDEDGNPIDIDEEDPADEEDLEDEGE